MRHYRTFEKKDLGITMSASAYTEDDGKVWRWENNDAVCPPESCLAFGIPFDDVLQEQARDAEVMEQLHYYHERFPLRLSDFQLEIIQFKK